MGCYLLDTNAVPRTAAKGHVILIDAVEVRVTLEPALGTKFQWLVEDVGIVQDVS